MSPGSTMPGYVFGAAEDDGKYRCMITAPLDGSTNEVYGYTSNGSTYTGVVVMGTKDHFNEIEYIINSDMASMSIRPNDNTSTKTATHYTMSNNLYLLGQNYNGTARASGERQVHYFKYYDKTNTLICDLVPCYRKSDSVTGMYDIIRKRFLTNAGSGGFSKGLDVALWRFNLMPFISTEKDGITIYNGGLGYKNGYRVRSGGAEVTQQSAVCTGFIPFVKGDKLYIYPPFTGLNI
jgi:hypothetical protein